MAGAAGLRSAEGNRLDRDAVRKLLCNISYTGQVAYKRREGGGVVAKGTHPTIVEIGLFEAVQKTLPERDWTVKQYEEHYVRRQR